MISLAKARLGSFKVKGIYGRWEMGKVVRFRDWVKSKSVLRMGCCGRTVGATIKQAPRSVCTQRLDLTTISMTMTDEREMQDRGRNGLRSLKLTTARPSDESLEEVEMDLAVRRGRIRANIVG